MIILILIVAVAVLGILAVFFFRSSEKQETEEHEKRLGTLEQQLYSQRDEQTQKMLEQAKAVRESKPAPIPELILRVARNGKDLGEMNIGVIKSMLRDGQLAPEDFFLDPASNEWMPLECHPALIG